MKTATQLAKRKKLTPLKRARLAFGLGQAEVAQQVEIDMAHISLLENGLRSPSLGIAQTLAQFYETTVDELFPVR